jgi:phosphoesterase RecJ-like protein
MNKILNNIQNAKHIMIVADNSTIYGASALYTHILRLHKKVSLVCDGESIGNNLSFLPWFDKVKTSKVTSADLTIEFKYSVVEFCTYLKNSSIKINKKMAIALYAGLLKETDGFLNAMVDGTIFALAKKLIECGAEHKMCTDFMLKRTTLAAIRIKAIMLKNMTLENSAKAAVFCIGSDDLKSSGATIDECSEVLKESLNLVHTEMAVLLDVDKEYRVLKLIYKEM